MGGISAADLAGVLEEGKYDLLPTLFRSDPDLYALLPELLADERIGVRLGASALVEELACSDPGNRPRAEAALVGMLGDADPVRRGDAAYLLGFAGGEASRGLLARLAAEDPDTDVREAAAEALERADPVRLPEEC